MIITEEYKQAIIEEINKDADFGFLLFKAILQSAGEQVVTTTYLDKALARQSIEFDEKLEKLTIEFDKKLLKLGEKLSAAFDEKLEQQVNRFDERLDQRVRKLEHFIDAKLGYIGSRWGEDIESTFLNFAQDVIAQWGGTARKWRRKARITDEHGNVLEHRYEVDIVVTNGKIVLVEVKSKCDLDDIERFLENIAYYQLTEKYAKPIEKAILTFFITTSARQHAEEEGIHIIMPQ